MKLVTGIEAIKSGKPFRYHYHAGTSPWFDKEMKLEDFNQDMTAEFFLRQNWEVKHGPREFWMREASNGICWEVTTTLPLFDTRTPVNWIKVREVVDDEKD